MSEINYMQVIPDSHYWTDINQLIGFVEGRLWLINNPDSIGLDLSMDGKCIEEYLLIGLKNTKSHGYNLSKEDILLCHVKEWVKFKFDEDAQVKENLKKETLYLVAKTVDEYIIINDTTKETIRLLQENDYDKKVILL